MAGRRAPEVLSPRGKRISPGSGTELTGALLKADRAIITVTGEKDGKLRLRASSWDEAVVVQPSEEIVLRNVDGQMHVYKAPRA